MRAEGSKLHDELTGKGLQAAANDRAKKRVEEVEAFRKPAGDLVADAAMPKKAAHEHIFAGAFEFGSKEAYSSLLRARGLMQSAGPQEQIARTSERAATAAEKSATLLKQIADAVGNRGGGDLATSLQAL